MTTARSRIPVDLESEKGALWTFRDLYRGKRIGLVYGPKSLEDRYYLEHAPPVQIGFPAIFDSLSRLGFLTSRVDPTSADFISSIVDSDWLFLSVHGEYGEDGRLQGMLDYLNKPYTGSGVLASATGMHKVMFKRILRGAGIKTPDSVDLTPGRCKDDNSSSFQLSTTIPAVVKPVSGGSSIGIQAIFTTAEAHALNLKELETALGPMFVEQFIPGRSLTVGVLELEYGTLTTPVIEVQFDAEYYDAATKLDEREQGLVRYVVPARLPHEIDRTVRETAVMVHNLIRCAGFSRTDFVLSPPPDEELFVLEINTIPGMSTTSNFVVGLEALGLSYDEVVLAMLRSCLWSKE